MKMPFTPEHQSTRAPETKTKTRHSHQNKSNWGHSPQTPSRNRTGGDPQTPLSRRSRGAGLFIFKTPKSYSNQTTMITRWLWCEWPSLV